MTDAQERLRTVQETQPRIDGGGRRAKSINNICVRQLVNISARMDSSCSAARTWHLRGAIGQQRPAGTPVDYRTPRQRLQHPFPTLELHPSEIGFQFNSLPNNDITRKGQNLQSRRQTRQINGRNLCHSHSRARPLHDNPRRTTARELDVCDATHTDASSGQRRPDSLVSARNNGAS